MEHRLLRSGCPITQTARLLLLPLLVLLLILQLAGPGQVAALEPPPGTVKIDSFSYSGSGCPPGSVAGVLSDDGKSMTVKFTKYLATTYKSSAHLKRTCTTSVRLSYPPEFTVGVESVSVSGYAKLDASVSGSITAWCYFSGETGTVRSKRVMMGIFDDNFNFGDSFAVPLYSRCGTEKSQKTINMGTEIKVSPGKKAKGGGFIRVDTTSQMNLVWQRC